MSTTTYDALIKLWRVVDEDLVTHMEQVGPDTELFQRGALTLGYPYRDPATEVPVLCNHDKARRIGYVRELGNVKDTDGEWLMAFCTIEDPPCWLERNTAASIGYSPVERGSFGAGERILKGWVNEVSVLAPGIKPAEPRAKVWSYRRSAAAKVTSDRCAAAGTTTIRRRETSGDREMDELRRRCDVAGWENFERVLKAYRYELGIDSALQLR